MKNLTDQQIDRVMTIAAWSSIAMLIAFIVWLNFAIDAKCKSLYGSDARSNIYYRPPVCEVGSEIKRLQLW